MSEFKICVHSGAFHADDVFGTAVALFVYPNAEIVRSRDASVWVSSDMLIDVGGQFDSDLNRFDHHQSSFTEERDGIPFASAGLLWRSYGKSVIRHLIESNDLGDFSLCIDTIHTKIDNEFVKYIDMADVGMKLVDAGWAGFSRMISAFNAEWVESLDNDAQFLQAVQFTKTYLARIIMNEIALFAADSLVKNATQLVDGRLLVLDKNVPWIDSVLKYHPAAQFIVYPNQDDGKDAWTLRTIPIELSSFTARKNLPHSWGGLRGAELSALTGIDDGIFCHKGLFIAATYSYDSIVKLAILAIDS